jgi:hypothetical protein
MFEKTSILKLIKQNLKIVIGRISEGKDKY